MYNLSSRARDKSRASGPSTGNVQIVSKLIFCCENVPGIQFSGNNSPQLNFGPSNRDSEESTVDCYYSVHLRQCSIYVQSKMPNRGK